MLQMVEYERHYGGQKDLSEFTRVGKFVQLTEMREWCEEVLREREGYWKSIGKSEIGKSLEKQMEVNGV